MVDAAGLNQVWTYGKFYAIEDLDPDSLLKGECKEYGKYAAGM